MESETGNKEVWKKNRQFEESKIEKEGAGIRLKIPKCYILYH